MKILTRKFASQSTDVKSAGKTFSTPQTLDSHLRSKKHLWEKQKAAANKKTTPEVEDLQEEAHNHPPAPVKAKSPKSPAAAVAAASTTSSSSTNSTGDSSIIPAAAATTAAEAATGSPSKDVDTALQCLFCDVRCSTIHLNLRHMFEKHDFRMPLWEDVSDERGLLQYLHLKLKAGLCMYCGGRSKAFQSVTGLRRHMFAKGHAQINWDEDAEEYADFYKLPESEPWKLEADEYGLCCLPDGRKISCRVVDDSAVFLRTVSAQDAGAGSHQQFLPAVPLLRSSQASAAGPHRGFPYSSTTTTSTAATKRQLLCSAASRMQVSQAVAQRLKFRFSVMRKFQKDRKLECRTSNYTSLKIASDHNRAMFHGFMV